MWKFINPLTSHDFFKFVTFYGIQREICHKVSNLVMSEIPVIRKSHHTNSMIFFSKSVESGYLNVMN